MDFNGFHMLPFNYNSSEGSQATGRCARHNWQAQVIERNYGCMKKHKNTSHKAVKGVNPQVTSAKHIHNAPSS